MEVMSSSKRSNDFPAPREYPQLAADLKSMSKHQRVPADLDQRVLSDLKHSVRPVVWGRRLAAAAIVVVAIGSISLFMIPQLSMRGGSTPRLAWDTTADGRVDVLDAFLLAKTIELGGFDDFSDFNHDGQVNAGDLAVLTDHIVRVGGSQDTDS
jgi:hypothetical protein